MSGSAPRSRSLVDSATGQAVELVYALPPEVLGQAPPTDTGISVAELGTRLRAGWFIIAATILVGAVLGISYALYLPDTFTAKVRALPPASASGKTGGIGQYADLAALAGVSLPGGGSSAEEIMAILASRTLADRLVDEFKLREYYEKERTKGKRDDLIVAFQKDFISNFDKKTSVISYQYTHESAPQAAAVANRASVLLQDIFNTIHQGSSRRELLFLEGRLALAEKDLLAAQEKLAVFQTENRAFKLEDQAKATVEAISSLQGQLIVQQVELRALLASKVGADNPEISLLKDRIEGLAKAIDRLIGATPHGNAVDGGGVLMGLGGLPELAVRYVGLYREVKKNETIVATLTTQVETSRIAVVRNAEVITIIDPAQVPEVKSGPRRALIALTATILGGLLGVALVFILKQTSPPANPDR